MNDIIMDMIRYFGPDARRINHALKVRAYACLIRDAERISGDKGEIVELAAILHDIGIREAERIHHSAAGHFQESEGPPVARRLMEARKIPSAIIERVCHLIGAHHSYHRIDGPDFRILIEADFIVNAFEDRLNPEAIETFAAKYFRTGSGTSLLRSIFLTGRPGPGPFPEESVI